LRPGVPLARGYPLRRPSSSLFTREDYELESSSSSPSTCSTSAAKARVRRQLAGQFFLHGEAGLLDANDFMSNLRAQRIKERGLHPVRASNFAVDCDDQEWADYLAGRDTWPPHVDASKATRRWKLGTSRGVSRR
jgi:hypothetical protein